MNIFSQAKKGVISEELKYVSSRESIPVTALLKDFVEGKITILKNKNRKINPVGVGKDLSTKVNANIGTSPDFFDIETEIAKLKAAEESGADAIMDLSTGGDLSYIRKTILEKSSLPLGTVPIYEAAVRMAKEKRPLSDFTIKDFLAIVKEQAEEGVDFMTIHSGVTKASVTSLHSQKRITGITSRGGSILAEWIKINQKENPLYEYYDEILDILAEYNVVISLGDGLRPGSVHDANDRGQIHEMIILGELAQRAREKNVQVIIEGPGHMPLNMIEDNIRLEKKLCDGAPYYVLGPLVTDIAPGYDHITGAIGGAIAAAAGADFLCYVTPAEHLRLPDVDDVRNGVIASKIAAHAADIVKLGQRARSWDDRMSQARKDRNWKEMYNNAIDKNKAQSYREQIPSCHEDQCSMCGEFCAMKREY
ncbi:MAG: Phosphomethylpyrimidine synthase [Spirochaetes bacterium ADurb.Bin218]|jgi:phosphomethylpyrimidine synthase|nr:MAG: Phosphomethylpyrimidine synthase [Spirochaetes bacterium ADurb.Bin218]HOV07929.1 phosphomethylpyrimidine synthase ThiC [Spirochaetota bacterium]